MLTLFLKSVREVSGTVPRLITPITFTGFFNLQFVFLQTFLVDSSYERKVNRSCVSKQLTYCDKYLYVLAVPGEKTPNKGDRCTTIVLYLEVFIKKF